MTWIKTIDEAEAEGEVRSAYAEVQAANGRVANILKVHSIHPKALRTHLALYRELMFGPSDLARPEREMIAVVVSVANHCHY